jgi:hypothetical protein
LTFCVVLHEEIDFALAELNDNPKKHLTGFVHLRQKSIYEKVKARCSWPWG